MLVAAALGGCETLSVEDLRTRAEEVAQRLEQEVADAAAPDGDLPDDRTSPDAPARTPAQSAPTAPQGAAAEALAGLEVKGRAPRTGYDRDAFGFREFDPERNGCDARNDVLRRDLEAVTVRPGTQGCVVESGVLADPYSGETLDFVRGQDTSARVQIDHVVALADAWQKGAAGWDEMTLRSFANDPLNLLAVDGPLNGAKGAGDAATWLPPHVPGRCDYVARQVAVKAAYGLWVTPAERDAIAAVLSRCPGQDLPEREVAPLGVG